MKSNSYVALINFDQLFAVSGRFLPKRLLSALIFSLSDWNYMDLICFVMMTYRVSFYLTV